MISAEFLAAAGAPTAPYGPKGRLTTYFSWFADDDVLCIAARDGGITVQQMDLGFCHALGHVGDRDLVVVAPPTLTIPMADRAAFLDIPIRFVTVGPTSPEELPIPRRTDVLDRYQRTPRGGTHDLGDTFPLVEPLLRALGARDELTPVDRQSYLTWHFQGRQVLEIAAQRRAATAKVIAGVDYSKPTTAHPAATRFHLTAPITEEQIAVALARVDAAIEDRRTGRDAANREHLLQEMFRHSPERLDLDPSHPVLREVPAERPVGNGYIDLLGVDRRGRLRIIETKIGPDDRLVVQGLDYWIWASANLPAVAEQLGLDGHPEVVIDYVVAEKGPGQGVVGQYSAGQAEALDRSISWRFTTVRDWMDGAPRVEPLAARELPLGSRSRPTPRKAGPRWAPRLEAHLTEAARQQKRPLRGGVFWPDAADALVPEALNALAQLTADQLAHPMVQHVRSSQAFALNLFASLDNDARAGVGRLAGLDLGVVDPVVFEWQDSQDALRERTAASPHNTQVDVALFGTDHSGTRRALLIEVKLTETDFNHCSAYLSPLNDRLDICNRPGAWGGSPEGCAQLRNLGRGERRRYDAFLTVSDSADATCGCSFRRGGNQPMRNAALAAMLVANGIVDDATTALCAPRAHRAIWRRWSEAKALLRGSGISMVDLAADDVAHLNPRREVLVAKYLLVDQ